MFETDPLPNVAVFEIIKSVLPYCRGIILAENTLFVNPLFLPATSFNSGNLFQYHEYLKKTHSVDRVVAQGLDPGFTVAAGARAESRATTTRSN